MLGLFIVVTYVEQRFIVLPNTAGKKELYGSNPCLDLQKNSLQQSFNFKKRVGESHILLDNLLVELFKCGHKMVFAGG